MAGAGTVLKVSKDLKRKCIAIDKDKECMRIPEQSYHPFRFIVTTDSAAL
jgi:hypothetical protein